MTQFPQVISVPDVNVSLGGTIFPVYEAEVMLSTYGQLGTANFKTSLALVGTGLPNNTQNAGAPVIGLGLNIPDDLSQQTYTPVQITFDQAVVFGGSYFMGDFTLESDEMSVHCRDQAAILFDTKVSLANGQYQNMTVSQLVTNLTNQYGLMPQVNLTNDPLVGTITQNNNIMATTPIQIWNLFVMLARQCGANIYTKPDGTLVFQDQQQGQQNNTNNLTWGATGQNQLVVPIAACNITHQPQRNKSFSVVVISHHAMRQVTSFSTTFVAGDPIQTSKTKKLKAGIYSGAAAGQIKSLTSNKALGIPQYIFHDEQGLTPDQCAARAQGFANEIAKRLFVTTISINGNANLKPLDQITIVDQSVNGSAYGFANRPLYISHLTHKFIHPQAGIAWGADVGFTTIIKALTLPPVINGGSTQEELGDILGGS